MLLRSIFRFAFALVALILLFSGCKQSRRAMEEDSHKQPAADILQLQPPTKQGSERFDLEKLRISVKPGEPIGLHEVPDKVLVGESAEFQVTLKRESEETGVGLRAYDWGPYHLGVIAGPEHVGIVKIDVRGEAVEPLEVYPDVWLGKTTRSEILARFGDTWKAAPDADLGYRAVQPAWVDCGYDESTGVLNRFVVQYVGDEQPESSAEDSPASPAPLGEEGILKP